MGKLERYSKLWVIIIGLLTINVVCLAMRHIITRQQYCALQAG